MPIDIQKITSFPSRHKMFVCLKAASRNIFCNCPTLHDKHFCYGKFQNCVLNGTFNIIFAWFRPLFSSCFLLNVSQYITNIPLKKLTRIRDIFPKYKADSPSFRRIICLDHIMYIHGICFPKALISNGGIDDIFLICLYLTDKPYVDLL